MWGIGPRYNQPRIVAPKWVGRWLRSGDASNVSAWVPHTCNAPFIVQVSVNEANVIEMFGWQEICYSVQSDAISNENDRPSAAKGCMPHSHGQLCVMTGNHIGT